MDLINIRHWWSRWRDYNLPQVDGHSNKWTSDWITLEKDQFYKVESFHGEYTGEDHATVSVEFEKTGTGAAKHHHATKEVQVLEVNNEIVYEKFNITVKNAMGGKFQIMFVNPKYDSSDKNSPKTITSRSIKDNDSENNFRYAIRDFYLNWRIWGSDIEVKKYSVNDEMETVTSGATKTVYEARVKKSIKDVGFAQAAIIKAKTTTSDIEINAPHVKSTPPLAGNFVIACKNKDNNEFVSREMGIYTDIDRMALYLHWDIPHLQFKLMVSTLGANDYRENGLDFTITFQDLHEDPNQCEIRTGTTTPLTGGVNLTYKSTTSRPYGNNLMFEPVPLEMLYHDADKPQVLVKVNKIEGLCPNFNCDYVYGTAASEVTA